MKPYLLLLLTAIIPLLASGTRYEYRVVELKPKDGESDAASLERTLNELAADGWRYCDLIVIARTVILERPVHDAPNQPFQGIAPEALKPGGVERLLNRRGSGYSGKGNASAAKFLSDRIDELEAEIQQIEATIAQRELALENLEDSEAREPVMSEIEELKRQLADDQRLLGSIQARLRETRQAR